MSALDGAKISVPALRELSKRLRTRASKLRGLAESLKSMGLDAYALEADEIAGEIHAASMRTETISIVLAHKADVEADDTKPIIVGRWCVWPPTADDGSETGAQRCDR